MGARFPWTFPQAFRGIYNKFSVFDWSFNITKSVVTEGYTDASGNWVADSSANTSIDGHVSDLSTEELKRLDVGLVAEGVRKLTCKQSESIDVGDNILITEPDASISSWRVIEKIYYSNLFHKYAGISRDSFLLKRAM